MKANELMIGDWLNFLIDIEGGDTEYEPQKAAYQPMQVDSIGFDVVTSEEGVTNAANQLQPISLTPEILKKNGFGYVENDVNPYNDEVLSHFYLGEEGYCTNVDIHIGTYNNGVFWFNSPKVSLNGIHYIHELQHALRLCNIDKEIEL